MKQASNIIPDAKGYSLWLVPTGETYDKLSGIIKRLAEEYNTPLFEPHITLLGEAPQSENDVIKRTRQLISGQKPFLATIRTLDYQDFYYRALFVKAEKTEPLLAFHERAKTIFEMPDIPPYMPHLSLLYGNFSGDIKKKIIKTIGNEFTEEFIVNAVHLIKSEGQANAWYKIKEFLLA